MDYLIKVWEFLPSIIVFAIIFSFLIIIHEWGHFFAARKSGVRVLEFGIGLGKKLWGKKYGETEFTINAIPFGGFVRMEGEEKSSKDPRSFNNAKLWKRMWITLNGIFMNILSAIIFLTIIFSVGTEPILITKNDVLKAQEQGLLVLGEVKEDGSREILEIKKIKKNIPEAFIFSIKETGRIADAILTKLGEIPNQAIEEGGVPEGLSGPVGIAVITHKILPQGFLAVLKLLALLSISLGIMNLLPIPALDGGRFLFQIFELILKPFGIKINEKIENFVHVLGYVLLLTFIFIITGNDIWVIFAK